MHSTPNFYNGSSTDNYRTAQDIYVSHLTSKICISSDIYAHISSVFLSQIVGREHRAGPKELGQVPLQWMQYLQRW